MADPILTARDVRVRFDTPRGVVDAVRGVDLEIAPGETLALVGESGSGKSAFAKALLRLHQPPFTPPRTTIEGRLIYTRRQGPVDLVRADDATIRSVRAREIGMVFQDALSALNPVVRIGDQVVEALHSAEPALPRAAARAAAVEIFHRIALPDPVERARSYPHQLSGGQRQRVMMAIAAVRKPRLLIADEPTTAVDVTVQARLVALLKDLQGASGMAMLFISHDLGLVAQIADRVAVMRAGRVVETAAVDALYARPQHPYTRTLLSSLPGQRRVAASPSRPAPGPPRGADPDPVALHDVTVTFGDTLFRRHRTVTAVDRVSLTVARGARLGLVGESGSGKSTLGRVILGLLRPDRGRVRVGGADPGRMTRAALKAFRVRVQAVFQDSAASLNPRMTVLDSVEEGLVIHRIATGVERRRRCEAMLERVGLDPALGARYPHMLSGGQRQRVTIARSLVLQPEILIADEPVSALDVSVQAQILDLLRGLHAEMGLTLVFISHDLWVVRELCDRVAVMRQGAIVEHGATDTLFAAPRHPYTKLLVASAPRPMPAGMRAVRRPGVAATATS